MVIDEIDSHWCVPSTSKKLFKAAAPRPSVAHTTQLLVVVDDDGDIVVSPQIVEFVHAEVL